MLMILADFILISYYAKRAVSFFFLFRYDFDFDSSNLTIDTDIIYSL